MFYKYIYANFRNEPKKYLNQILPELTEDEKSNEKAFPCQMASQIIDLAGVAYRKFTWFNVALWWEFSLLIAGAASAVALLLIHIFLK